MILVLANVTQNIIVETETLNQFYRQLSSSAANIVSKYETLILKTSDKMRTAGFTDVIYMNIRGPALTKICAL
jgi:hypothetical protein